MADDRTRPAEIVELEDLRTAFHELTERLEKANRELEKARADLERSNVYREELERKLADCQNAFVELQAKFRERTDWAIKLRDEIKALKALNELRNPDKK